MNLVGKIHDSKIHTRRIRSLLRNLVPLLPTKGTVLDVGCGDGLLAKLISQELPNLDLQGIDVMVRAETKIPVAEFDGTQIPMDDNSVDVVMLSLIHI